MNSQEVHHDVSVSCVTISMDNMLFQCLCLIINLYTMMFQCLCYNQYGQHAVIINLYTMMFQCLCLSEQSTRTPWCSMSMCLTIQLVHHISVSVSV